METGLETSAEALGLYSSKRNQTLHLEAANSRQRGHSSILVHFPIGMGSLHRVNPLISFHLRCNIPRTGDTSNGTNKNETDKENGVGLSVKAHCCSNAQQAVYSFMLSPSTSSTSNGTCSIVVWTAGGGMIISSR